MRFVSFPDINDEHKDLAARCVGVVEANSFERLSLWQKKSPRSETSRNPVNTWQDLGSGCMFHVGDCDGRPVNVEISFACINGKWVMFYWPCSQVVDFNLVEEWLEKYMSHARKSDAMNFHNIIFHINDLNKKEAEENV